MSGYDDINLTSVQVGPAQVDGTATTLCVYQGVTASHYKCDTTRTTLAGNGEYGSGSGQVPNTGPAFSATGGLDTYLTVDNTTATACFVDLPNVDLTKNPNGHPLRGRTITISNLGTTSTTTITAPSTGSGNAAPQINGAASPNSALLASGARHAVELIFDGLNWLVTGVL
jgi:hypothetical protein